MWDFALPAELVIRPILEAVQHRKRAHECDATEEAQQPVDAGKLPGVACKVPSYDTDYLLFRHGRLSSDDLRLGTSGF